MNCCLTGRRGSPSLDGKRGLDPKKLTLIFAGFGTLVILVFLYYVVFSEDPITIEDETIAD